MKSEETRQGTPEKRPAPEECAAPRGLEACRPEDLTPPSDPREIAVGTQGPAFSTYEPLSEFLRKQQLSMKPSDAPA